MKPVISIFAALLAMPSAAFAQFGGGHSGMSTLHTYSGQSTWDDLSAFGICYAGKESANALKLVATEAGSVDEARVYKALFSNEDQLCLGDISEMSVPFKFVRGAVAEGLYVKRVPVPAQLAAKHAMPRESVRSIIDTATCYALQHQGNAVALIETTNPGTRKESDAVDALQKDFVACLPPNLPQAVQIDATLLRFRIAEALWRLGVVHP